MTYGIRKGEKEHKRSVHIALMLLCCVFALCCAVFLWNIGEWVYDYCTRSTRYDSCIRNAAYRNHIDPALVKALIWQESRFNRNAKGLTGEIGLMQIMRNYAVTDWAKVHRRPIPSTGALYDPDLNIEIGSWYLARALSRYQTYRHAVALALCEYNAGARRASDWKPKELSGEVLDRISIPSTKAYVKAILSRYEYYKKEYKQQGGYRK